MKRLKSIFRTKGLIVLAILLVLLVCGIWGIGNYRFVRNAGLDDDTPVRVQISVDKESATIGDKIQYKINVVASSDVEVKLPLPGERLSDMTIDSYSDILTRYVWGVTSYEQVYTLTTFETGKHVVSSPQIVYIVPGEDERIITGNDVTVTIRSLLLDGDGALDIKDIKPLQVPPREYRPFALIALGLIGFAVVATSISRAIIFRQVMDLSEVCIMLPAHEIAYDELERARTLLKTGFTERFYVRISECVRRYLENRFQINAMEMATEELLLAVQDREELHEHKELLEAFLANCDLVKFGRFTASEEEAWRAYYLAKKLVDETKEMSEEGSTGSEGNTESEVEVSTD